MEQFESFENGGEALRSERSTRVDEVPRTPRPALIEPVWAVHRGSLLLAVALQRLRLLIMSSAAADNDIL
jgi:hypothetical protein